VCARPIRCPRSLTPRKASRFPGFLPLYPRLPHPPLTSDPPSFLLERLCNITVKREGPHRFSRLVEPSSRLLPLFITLTNKKSITPVCPLAPLQRKVCGIWWEVPRISPMTNPPKPRLPLLPYPTYSVLYIEAPCRLVPLYRLQKVILRACQRFRTFGPWC